MADLDDAYHSDFIQRVCSNGGFWTCKLCSDEVMIVIHKPEEKDCPVYHKPREEAELK